MKTFRMTVSYLGTAFAGWQIQRRGDTIQGRLQEALGRLLGQPVAVAGAGRTDAGVHARGQVAHFRAMETLSPARLVHGLNSLLPRDIRVERLSRAAAAFHARKDARWKHYRYLLHLGRKPSPFEADRVGWMPGAPPDLAPMRAAATHLVGRHDFSSFCGSGTAVDDCTRRVMRLDLRRRGDTMILDVVGDGFLRHQVRNMVRTLAQVGQGRRTPGSLVGLLAARNRRQAGPTAPAQGLCLMRVGYGPLPAVRGARGGG